jgi:predicted Zn-dependent protease with MMP-like domain
MTAAEFEIEVEKALRRIPLRFRKRLHNVSIVVEKEAPRRNLLGLYEGLGMLPDRITLFQKPIEREARGPADVPRVIAETLWHEIAHYFGMDERQVQTAERRRIFRRFRERLR